MKKLRNILLVLLLSVITLIAVTLEWDPSPDAWVSGYRLHYGYQSSNYVVSTDVRTNTSHTYSNLVPGKTYFFVATAYANYFVGSGFESNSMESLPSNEVSYTVPDPALPSIKRLSIASISP